MGVSGNRPARGRLSNRYRRPEARRSRMLRSVCGEQHSRQGILVFRRVGGSSRHRRLDIDHSQSERDRPVFRRYRRTVLSRHLRHRAEEPTPTKRLNFLAHGEIGERMVPKCRHRCT